MKYVSELRFLERNIPGAPGKKKFVLQQRMIDSTEKTEWHDVPTAQEEEAHVSK
jgi:hypothetical protein